MNFNRLRFMPAQALASAVVAFVLGVSCQAAEAPQQPGCESWKFGSEIDALPYMMKGYYASAFTGRDGWRYRVVAARSATPSFFVTDGFKDKRSDAYAALVDRFFGSKREQLQGFWIGGGGEYWRNRIRTADASEFAHFDNFMLTVGGGYVWKVSRHFYLNPWAGGHFVAAGARRIQVSGQIYEQPVFTPEFSVKFGFVR